VKVGLFGGSFDPIHRGHIDAAHQARRSLSLERVLFLPTAQPPHKTGSAAGALARMAMVELGLLHEEGLYASPHELTLGRTAYTAETLEHFRRQMPEAELYLLLGSDSFLDLPNWVRWRDIVAAARLVVLPRPGWEVTATAPGNAPLAALLESGAAQVLEWPPCEVSSTRLRQMLSRDELPPASWLPDLVLEFIHKYHLYR
jgi:nicotinate-nucleotide adenylyltransferase